MAIGTNVLFSLNTTSLTQMWGITSENIAKAPLWTRVFLANWGEFAAAAQYIMMGITAVLAVRVIWKETIPWGNPYWIDALIPCAVLAALILTDELRVTAWRGFTAGTAVLTGYVVLRSLGEETLLRGLVQRGAGAVAGVLLSVAVAMLSGASDIAQLILEALVGAVCAALYAKGNGVLRGVFLRLVVLWLPDVAFSTEGGTGLFGTVFVGGHWTLTAAQCVVLSAYLAIICRKELRRAAARIGKIACRKS